MNKKIVKKKKTGQKTGSGSNIQYQLITTLRKTPYILDKRKKVTIGKTTKNTFCLPFNTVSDLHASIKWDKKAYLLTDEDSTNGVFINGKRVAKKEKLTDGDKIKIGRNVFRFQEVGSEPGPVAKKTTRKKTATKTGRKTTLKKSTTTKRAKTTSRKTTRTTRKK